MPEVADADAVNVNTLLAAVVAGLKAAVTPAGKPVAARLTVPANPFWSMTLRVAAPVLDWLIESAAKELESAKEGAPDVPVRS